MLERDSQVDIYGSETGEQCEKEQGKGIEMGTAISFEASLGSQEPVTELEKFLPDLTKMGDATKQTRLLAVWCMPTLQRSKAI